MKIIFAGTPQFATTALDALIHSPHEIIAVYTQPDRKSGRGLKLTASPVKELALQNSLPLYQPASLKNEEEQEKLAALKADAIIVAAYGLLLPAQVLSLAKFGCINIHPSLLPNWRGAAPIQRTIAAGDKVTGVTIMQMDQGLDTGPILLQKSYVLEPDETSLSLHDKLAELGATCLLETLDLLEKGEIKPHAQNNEAATYAHKVSKEEALIDWQRPAFEIEQEIRAFTPWPVCYSSWEGEHLRIWQAKVLPTTTTMAPRTLVDASHAGIDVATGDGVLRLLKLQLPGGKVLTAREFFNAKHDMLIKGKRF